MILNYINQRNSPRISLFSRPGEFFAPEQEFRTSCALPTAFIFTAMRASSLNKLVLAQTTFLLNSKLPKMRATHLCHRAPHA